MVQIQIVIDFQFNDNNTIAVNELTRADANDREREVASSIYNVLRDMVLAVRDEVGADQMKITEIG